MGSAKRIAAAIIAAVGLIFFALTQIANVIAIAHLPRDLREALVELSHVPTLAAYVILVIGLCGIAYLFLDMGIQHHSFRRATATTAARREEAERDWPIRELFAYIRPDLPLTSVGRTGNTTVDNLDERWRGVGACVLRQLSLGRLHATGRQHRGTRRLQAAPIPSDVWSAARFTYWFLDEDGREVLHAENADGAQYSEIEVNGAEASTIWERISLREAAVRVHEELRDVDGFFNQGNSPDETLDHVALFILHTVPIEAKRPPSTRWERLSEADVNQLMPGGGAAWLGGDAFHNEATRIIEARVKRKDVDRVISEHRQQPTSQ
jgi:hypothetical protein